MGAAGLHGDGLLGMDLGTGLGLHISQMAKGHGVKKSLEFTQLIKAIGACALGSARTGLSGTAALS